MQKPGTRICDSTQGGQRSDRLSIARREPKLLDQLDQALRSRHRPPRIEQTYCLWVKRSSYFKNSRHPAGMTEPKIGAMLTRPAVSATNSDILLPCTCGRAAIASDLCTSPFGNRSNEVSCGQETRTPHLMRINLIIVRHPIYPRKGGGMKAQLAPGRMDW